MAATRRLFDQAATAARWTGTAGARFALQFWFARRPVFWLPRGWLPAYAEWLLALPKAPAGAVSVHVWWLACAGALQLLLADVAVPLAALCAPLVVSAVGGVVGSRSGSGSKGTEKGEAAAAAREGEVGKRGSA